MKVILPSPGAWKAVGLGLLLACGAAGLALADPAAALAVCLKPHAAGTGIQIQKLGFSQHRRQDIEGMARGASQE